MAKAKTETKQENGKGNAPVKKYRARGVSVSVFENVAEDGRKYHKASSPMKTYKEGDEFKSAYSLGLTDIPVAIYYLEQAYAFMLEAEAANGAVKA